MFFTIRGCRSFRNQTDRLFCQDVSQSQSWAASHTSEACRAMQTAKTGKPRSPLTDSRCAPRSDGPEPGRDRWFPYVAWRDARGSPAFPRRERAGGILTFLRPRPEPAVGRAARKTAGVAQCYSRPVLRVWKSCLISQFWKVAVQMCINVGFKIKY